MIKYESMQNKYYYNKKDVENIVKFIKNENYYNSANCTKEKVGHLIDKVNYFLDNITIKKEKVSLERHETEEEAREYFGSTFINTFDNLLTKLDKEQTIVALHGTSVSTCPEICKTGLKYKNPTLNSTALSQTMAYGQHDIHYSDYTTLLNWQHRNYKGLVIVAIPYECYYKEGLWNHFQITNSSFYGGQDYRIDPDFIVGYIDVNNKKIVLNSKYNRHHNYEGYVKDSELFREIKDMNNDKFAKYVIEFEKSFEESSDNLKEYPTSEDSIRITPREVPYYIENLTALFNSIKDNSSESLTEDVYRHLLKQLSTNLNIIASAIPLLKTDEQVAKEEEAKNTVFIANNLNDSDDDELDWENLSEWDFSEDDEEEQVFSPRKK